MSHQNAKYDYTPIGPLAEIITQFLQYKRSLGFKYIIEEGILYRFSLLSEKYNVDNFIIPEPLIGEWCIRKEEEKVPTYRGRVCLIFRFCKYAQQYGYSVVIPELPKLKSEKYQPYIFNTDEIARIIKAADHIEYYPGSLFSIQAPILYRLLFSTGIRASEACNLKWTDYDADLDVLTITNSKFNKDRLIPLSESMSNILNEYLNRYRWGESANEYIFQGKYIEHIKRKHVYYWFRILLDKADIPHLGKGYGPREHDVRHTFAVNVLKKMQNNGIDLYAGLPLLSVYLGHASIKESQYYLKLTSELYPDVLALVEANYSNVIPEIGGEDRETN